jgi:hypothetical protein
MFILHQNNFLNKRNSLKKKLTSDPLQNVCVCVFFFFFFKYKVKKKEKEKAKKFVKERIYFLCSGLQGRV